MCLLHTVHGLFLHAYSEQYHQVSHARASRSSHGKLTASH